MFTIIWIVSCEGDIYEDASNSIVVEGYIEQDKPPCISLMEMLPVSSQYQSLDSIGNSCIKDAFVRVTVDSLTYDLVVEETGRSDQPFVYTSHELRGVEGKKYALDILYEGQHITASTSIPNSVPLLTITPTQSENNTERYMLTAQFVDNIKTKDYYKTFVSSSDVTHYYLSSFMGNFDDADFTTDTVTVAILNGRTVYNDHYYPLFQKGETVGVKFCHMEKDAYLYWNEYEKALISSRNPLFSIRKNLPSNITGGVGCWFGYGTTYYDIEINE